MSLFTHPSDGKRLYLAHPPRTGGRYIYNLFVANGWLPTYDHFDLVYKNQELPHCDLSRYRDFININEIPVFGVVRHPLDRFLSITSLVADRTPDTLERLKYSNLFTPQTNFFPEQSYLWKFEQGFNENFIEFLEHKTNTAFSVKRVSIPRAPIDDYQKISATPELKALALAMYKEDYDRFGYEY